MSAVLFELHGAALRRLAAAQGRHFEGLQQASRIAKAKNLLPDKLAKRLQRVDVAFNVLRHITGPSADQLLHDLDKALHTQKDEDEGCAEPLPEYMPLEKFEPSIETIETTTAGQAVSPAQMLIERHERAIAAAARLNTTTAIPPSVPDHDNSHLDVGNSEKALNQVLVDPGPASGTARVGEPVCQAHISGRGGPQLKIDDTSLPFRGV